jgi:hypothetical protein
MNVTGFFSILAEWSRAESSDPSDTSSDDPKLQSGGVRHDR